MAAKAKNDAQRIAEHEARVELYAQRVDLKLDIFTGAALSEEDALLTKDEVEDSLDSAVVEI
jgi:hypothetical protein